MVYKKASAKRRNVFEELKLSIMQGMFKPRERLMERALAARFGVSRTPIREALQKLQNMGLVRIIPNQGARVEDFSLEDIESLYLVRLHLEQLAGRLACRRCSLEDLKNLTAINRDLRQAFAGEDFPRMIAKDQEFHLTLIGFSRNPFLFRVIQDLRTRSHPISYYYWRSKKYLQESLAEHTRMIQALRHKKMDEMDRLIELQLNHARARYLKYLSQTFPEAEELRAEYRTISEQFNVQEKR